MLEVQGRKVPAIDFISQRYDPQHSNRIPSGDILKLLISSQRVGREVKKAFQIQSVVVSVHNTIPKYEGKVLNRFEILCNYPLYKIIQHKRKEQYQASYFNIKYFY